MEEAANEEDDGNEDGDDHDYDNDNYDDNFNNNNNDGKGMIENLENNDHDVDLEKRKIRNKEGGDYVR